jgi:hypothetical protein
MHTLPKGMAQQYGDYMALWIVITNLWYPTKTLWVDLTN